MGYAGLEIRGILEANATMFSHLLPGFSFGSKHLLLPQIHGIVCDHLHNRRRLQRKHIHTILLPQN